MMMRRTSSEAFQSLDPRKLVTISTRFLTYSFRTFLFSKYSATLKVCPTLLE